MKDISIEDLYMLIDDSLAFTDEQKKAIKALVVLKPKKKEQLYIILMEEKQKRTVLDSEYSELLSSTVDAELESRRIAYEQKKGELIQQSLDRIRDIQQRERDEYEDAEEYLSEQLDQI